MHSLEPNTRVIVLALVCLVGAVVFLVAGKDPDRADPKELGRLTFFAALLALLWALCVR